MRNIGIVILAAGGSARMGTAKQLLPFQGRSLIRRAVETAIASVCRPIVVVVGAQADQVELELKGLPVIIARNDHWQLGIGSSIRTGLGAVVASGYSGNTQTDGVLIALCDQPLVLAEFLNELAAIHLRTEGGIVASAYNGILGVPALFSRNYYNELLTLPSKEGAKCVIERHREKVQPVQFPDGAIDIDTKEDYERILDRVRISV